MRKMFVVSLELSERQLKTKLRGLSPVQFRNQSFQGLYQFFHLNVS